MVVAVGYDPCSGNLDVYNTETKFVQELVVEKLNPNDIENLHNFFQSLRIRLNFKIDCFCLALDCNYSSEFRRSFVGIAEIYDIEKVRITGFQHLQLIGAIRYLSDLPKSGDLLWIMYFRQDCLLFTTWIFDQIKGWEFQNTHLLKNIGELHALEADNQIKCKTPSIFVYNIYKEGYEAAIKTLFPYFKEIKFQQLAENSYWSLQYARHYLQEPGFEKYKTGIIFERRIKVCITDNILFQALPSLRLPFYDSLIINVDETEELKVFENNECVFTRTFNKEGTFEIVFNIDINGVYSTHCKKHIKDNGVQIRDIFTPRRTFKFQKNYSIPMKMGEFDPNLNAIGIDLGTTECCVSVIRKNGPDFVALDPVTGFRTLPSYVAFDEVNPKCGKIVVDRMRYHASCTVCDSKRIMGRSYEKIVIDSLWPFTVTNGNSGAVIEVNTFEGQKSMAPEEIAAVLLEHIKSNLESYQTSILSEAVIAIPSGSTDEQIAATSKAATIAGWETVHFLPEPVAAAFAYFTEKEFASNCNIIICDCGGGTVDICVAKVFDGKFELLNYDGDSYLGGRDFDKLLFNHFETILKHKYEINVSKSNKKYLLNQMCQNIKHTLSTVDKDLLAVDSFKFDSNDFIPIQREEFETLALPLILKMKDVILRSISKANIQKNQINYVFQVGGGCRMPMIKEMLKEIFPNSDHQCSIYPDWVVAHGAALYAYHLKTKNDKRNETPIEGKVVKSIKEKIETMKKIASRPFMRFTNREKANEEVGVQ